MFLKINEHVISKTEHIVDKIMIQFIIKLHNK